MAQARGFAAQADKENRNNRQDALTWRTIGVIRVAGRPNGGGARQT
jgi:hypothetical protein